MANQTELLNVSDEMKINEKGQIIEEQEHGEELCSSSLDTTEELYSLSAPDTCGDGLSTVKKQVKKYGNRLKTRDSERFAEIGSLLESLFSCFDNSVIVCLLIG